MIATPTDEPRQTIDRSIRFKREPLSASMLLLVLERIVTSSWLCDDHELWKRAMRKQRLILHWWVRGIQAQAWDNGYKCCSGDDSCGDNPLRYAPDWHRRFRTVAECFEVPQEHNPFIGAKRRTL